MFFIIIKVSKYFQYRNPLYIYHLIVLFAFGTVNIKFETIHYSVNF